MEQQMRMAKPMIDLQKVMFDVLVNNMMMFWEQTEGMLGAFLDQANWLPPEGKGAFKEWIARNKKGCESFRKTTHEGFTWMEGFMNGRPGQQQSE